MSHYTSVRFPSRGFSRVCWGVWEGGAGRAEACLSFRVALPFRCIVAWSAGIPSIKPDMRLPQLVFDRRVWPQATFRSRHPFASGSPAQSDEALPRTSQSTTAMILNLRAILRMLSLIATPADTAAIAVSKISSTAISCPASSTVLVVAACR